MEDLAINTILIMELHMANKLMSNNYKSEGFGKQEFKDELSRVWIKSTKVFVQSSGVFPQTLNLVRLVNVLPQLVDELTQLANIWTKSA
jgi:hypothetical protein